MIPADGNKLAQDLLLVLARGCLVTSPQRAGQLNSCCMSKLCTHRALLDEDSNGHIFREAAYCISKMSDEAMRTGAPAPGAWLRLRGNCAPQALIRPRWSHDEHPTQRKK